MPAAKKSRKRPDRRYLRNRSLKPDTRHDDVSDVLVQHRIDVFRNLPTIAPQIYRNGAALAVMTGGPREPGSPPYQLHSLWINPGLHIRLIKEDDNKHDRIVPRTRVNPGKLLPQSQTTVSTIDHLLFVEKQAAIVVTRNRQPAFVILPPDAIDRVPAATIALVRIYRENRPDVVPEKPQIQELSIEDEIERLVGCADEARRLL